MKLSQKSLINDFIIRRDTSFEKDILNLFAFQNEYISFLRELVFWLVLILVIFDISDDQPP